MNSKKKINKITCCLDCDKRKVGCHAECVAYNEQAEALARMRITERKEKALRFL